MVPALENDKNGVQIAHIVSLMQLAYNQSFPAKDTSVNRMALKRWCISTTCILKVRNKGDFIASPN
jgi:hypothetical protein